MKTDIKIIMLILVSWIMILILSGCTATNIRLSEKGNLDATYGSILKDVKFEKITVTTTAPDGTVTETETFKGSGTQAPKAIYECAALITAIVVLL